METDEELYHATPQTIGKISHSSIDNKSSHQSYEISSLPIYSEELGLYGKIDIYNQKTKRLIERKYQLKHIFIGQIYQLWAQYFCLIEMGYEVNEIAFYEISTNKMLIQNLPTPLNKEELKVFIQQYRNYDPNSEIKTNTNKCLHCVYCNLCDKTITDNVY